jgi:hypothetical protein
MAAAMRLGETPEVKRCMAVSLRETYHDLLKHACRF